MPTGNTRVLYASGNSTVPSAANSVCTISITATAGGNTAAGSTFLINISPTYS